ERERAVRATAEQIALLDDQIAELRRKLERASKDSFRPLRAIKGIGAQITCTIIAELGAPRPGFGDEQLAALAGVAPLEASSAGVTRHRVNRGGNRRLTRALHRIVLTQARTHEPARAYPARGRAAARADSEARRSP